MQSLFHIIWFALGAGLVRKWGRLSGKSSCTLLCWQKSLSSIDMVVWFLQKVQDIFVQFPVAWGNEYQAETTDYKTFCTIYSMAFFREISPLYHLWVPKESSCFLSHSTWSLVLMWHHLDHVYYTKHSQTVPQFKRTKAHKATTFWNDFHLLCQQFQIERSKTYTQTLSEKRLDNSLDRKLSEFSAVVTRFLRLFHLLSHFLNTYWVLTSQRDPCQATE